MAKTWFLFTGTNPFLENDYTLVGSQPLCPGSTTICAIFAEPNIGGTKPQITPAFCSELSSALQNRTDNTNILLRL